MSCDLALAEALVNDVLPWNLYDLEAFRNAVGLQIQQWTFPPGTVLTDPTDSTDPDCSDGLESRRVPNLCQALI